MGGQPFLSFGCKHAFHRMRISSSLLSHLKDEIRGNYGFSNGKKGGVTHTYPGRARIFTNGQDGFISPFCLQTKVCQKEAEGRRLSETTPE